MPVKIYLTKFRMIFNGIKHRLSQSSVPWFADFKRGLANIVDPERSGRLKEVLTPRTCVINFFRFNYTVVLDDINSRSI